MIKINSNNRNPNQPDLAEGNYTGEVVKVEYHPTEEETNQGVVPPYGPYLTFVFKIVDNPQYPNTLKSGICSASRNPKSKLATWLSALGVSIASLGDQLDESALLHKKVELEIKANKNNGRLNVVGIKPLGASNLPPTAPLGLKPKSALSPQLSRPATPPQTTRPQTTVTSNTQASLPDMDDVPF